MSKKSTTQYQQNIDIIKSFFRKPVVLVAGILTIIASVANSVVEYLSEYKLTDVLDGLFGPDAVQSFSIGGTAVAVFNKNNNAPNGFSLDLLAIAMGISLILLFAFGGSKSNSIVGGVTFFKVMTHIYYVCYFILAVCAVVLVIFTFAFSIDTVVKIILIVSFLAIGFFVFLFGYSQLQFAKSVKESMNSIYLSNSGAKLHGTVRIITAVAMGLTGAFGVFAIMEFAGFEPASIIASIVPVVIMIANQLMWAVMSLKYHSYINGITSGKIEMPVVVTKEEKEMVCNNCGSPVTDEDVFCSVCGNKVQDNYEPPSA